MFCKNGVLLLCVLTIASYQAALADSEDRSEETSQEIVKLHNNESSSAEMGFPDSHEAMNNREMSLRDKRSYEFLMGLIKNNSKYEVTRTEPPTKIRKTAGGEDPNATASEILLELMVRIAAHPDHWNRVHHLLENIDKDLMKSKKLVEDLQKAKIKTEPETAIALDKKEGGIFKNKSESHLINNEWPTFQDEVEMNNKVSKVTFVNTASPENYHIQSDQHKNTYPKTFAYHRVTGRPMFLNKNPKAYIAVSVIAPKPMMSRSKDEDLILEKELRQLKPWTHSQNLKNMASIRSRWVIQSRDEDVKNSVAP